MSRRSLSGPHRRAIPFVPVSPGPTRSAIGRDKARTGIWCVALVRAGIVV